MFSSQKKRKRVRSASDGNLIFPHELIEKNNANHLPAIVTSSNESIGRFKVIVIGDKSCGKTSLLNSFVKNTFETEMPLIFEGGVSTLKFGTKQLDFVMWDLSGCIDYDGLRSELYQDTDMFLVCFDIGNTKSFQNVTENWIPELALEKPHTPFILVGCKNDLRSDHSICCISKQLYDKKDDDCSVSREKGERTAQEWGAKEYIECCAKTGYNVTEVFRTAAHVLLTQLDDKNNQSGLKFGFSKFTKRKSAELGDIFYHHQAKSNITFRRGSAFA